MQLTLWADERAKALTNVHRRLRRALETQGPFRQLDPVSQLVLSLIGSRTLGAVSASAFTRLRLRFVTWDRVRDAPVGSIERTITAVAFAPVKARHLQASLRLIACERGSLSLDHLEPLRVDEALRWLERLPGVGRKVAAATLNFSTLRKPALVIDTHHRRVLHRLGLVSANTAAVLAYERVMAWLGPDWTAADLDEHHQLMKSLGQTFCRPIRPHCGRCPLNDRCVSAARVTSASGRRGSLLERR